MLDIGGYRAQPPRRALPTTAGSVAEEVARTGEPKTLAAMSPFERKIVHDAVAAAGQRSESEGEEPNRRVVVYPARLTSRQREPEAARGRPLGDTAAAPSAAPPPGLRPRVFGARRWGRRRWRSPGYSPPAGSSKA